MKFEQLPDTFFAKFIFTFIVSWGVSMPLTYAQDPILIGGTEGVFEPKPHPQADLKAKEYLVKNAAKLNLTLADVQNHIVQDVYTTKHNGLTHVIFIQQHQQIPLHNGILNVNVMPDGSILNVGNRFMKNLAGSINGTQAVVAPENAIILASSALKIELNEIPRLQAQKGTSEWLFGKGNAFGSDINVQLCFEQIAANSARLAYNFALNDPKTGDYWSVRIDAQTGQLLGKNNWTRRCKFHPGAFNHQTEDCSENHNHGEEKEGTSHFDFKKVEKTTSALEELSVGGGTYRVFALPAESPAHGNHIVVTDPADSLASPFGWHDINGAAGAEYRTTRGNNVNAYTDHNNTDNNSANSAPNGGASLVFDYPFSPNGEPDTNRNAAVTNLFYVNNIMHDFAYRYGFDEQAGNFQEKNYTGVPGKNDPVRAEAQDSYKTSTIETDNANFQTPPDGSSPRMQMYVWSRVGDKLLHVTSPASLIGDYVCGIATFGPDVDTNKIAGQVALVNDGSQNPTFGCTELLNTNLTGKIALIDRGSCSFIEKVFQAQQKGAIGVIIINVDEETIRMGIAGTNRNIKIPVVSVRKSVGERLRTAAIGGTLRVSLFNDQKVEGPQFLDGDFDNGIIAHEYGHGIGNRLTGGRLNVDCLSQGEQAAGEGWSDFLALAITTRPTDRAKTRRGIGTYVLRQGNDDVGIRRFSYSTEMNVNPLTYDDIIIDSEVHNVGEVWTAVLWDLYWAMVDLYGWDGKWQNTESGNGKTIKLVIDGMKLQPCNPGFLDARDAILAADRANYKGLHQCLIWRVFARRGMGADAEQLSPLSLSDNTQGFALPCECSKALKVLKEATESIKAGGEITYKVTALNYKGSTLTNVVVTDELPQGTNYVVGSASRAVTVRNGILTWNIGTMPNDTTFSITYRVTTDANRRSIAQFIDNMESGIDKWDGESLKGSLIWENTDRQSRSGVRSFWVTSAPTDFNDQTLEVLNPITVRGTQPVLGFYHKYDTHAGFDGGIVQITTDNGRTWEDVSDKIFRNPYRGIVSFQTFALPNVKAFWGKMDSFIGTYVDLSSYLGKNIKFRFRFGSDNKEASNGWYIDDVAIMDMYNYNSRARITSAQGDEWISDVAGRGTIVQPSLGTSLSTIEKIEQLNVKVSPNPARDLLNINILPEKTESATLELISTDGRVIWQNKQKLVANQETLTPLSISGFPAGLYVVKIKTESRVFTEKIIFH